MYIAYMAGRPPRQKAKNDARQQLCVPLEHRCCSVLCLSIHQSPRMNVRVFIGPLAWMAAYLLVLWYGCLSTYRQCFCFQN